MQALTPSRPGAPLFRCWACSVLLHVGVIMLVGILHVSQQDTPDARVTVTLQEPPPVPEEPPPPEPPPPDAPPVTPKTPTRLAMPTPAKVVPRRVQHVITANANTAPTWTVREAAPARPTALTNTSKVFRDGAADRKGLRTPARHIKGASDKPRYPSLARRRGWEGTVMLRITVSREGTVEHIVIQKSSEHDILDESAIQAVQAWKFEPARDGEFAVASTVELPVRFALEDS